MTDLVIPKTGYSLDKEFGDIIDAVKHKYDTAIIKLDKLEGLFSQGYLSIDEIADYLINKVNSHDYLALMFNNNYSVDFLSKLFNSSIFNVNQVADIWNKYDLNYEKIVYIMKNNDMDLEKKTDVLRFGGLLYDRLYDIINNDRYKDYEFNQLMDSISFDYEVYDLSGWTIVENNDPDGNGSESVDGNTFTVGDGGGSYGTWASIYTKPNVSVNGNTLYVFADVSYSVGGSNYYRAGFSITLKDDSGNLHSVVIDNYNGIGFYGYNDQPESISDYYMVVQLLGGAGETIYRGIISLPFTAVEIYAISLGIMVYSGYNSITLESGGIKVAIGNLINPPNNYYTIRYTAMR